MLQNNLFAVLITDRIRIRKNREIGLSIMNIFKKSIVSRVITMAMGTASLTFSAMSVASTNIDSAIKQAEQQLGAKVGVSVLNANGDSLYGYNSDQRFPLMSTFKTLACAKLLHDNQITKGMMDKTYPVTAEAILDYAPVFKDKVGTEVSLKDACFATMTTSDNSAANFVLAHIGGAEGVTKFLIDNGDNVTRLDRIEPLLNEATPGDKRDTTTPYAMNETITKLVLGDALNPASKAQLTEWMKANKVSNGLFRSVLPQGWVIADRSGAGGYGSRGITAVVWNEQKQPLVISVYLTGTEASIPERDKEIAKIGNAIFERYTR